MNENILGVDIRHLQLFRTRLDSLGQEDQFKKIATMFIGADYKMGSENFNECDCSGLICSSLNGMGHKIRLNANDLITHCCDPGYDRKLGNVGIVGFYNKKVKKYSHIGIIFHSPSADTILHASYPIGTAFEELPSCAKRYQDNGYRVDYFTLNFLKVEGMNGKVYGLDEDFK